MPPHSTLITQQPSNANIAWEPTAGGTLTSLKVSPPPPAARHLRCCKALQIEGTHMREISLCNQCGFPSSISRPSHQAWHPISERINNLGARAQLQCVSHQQIYAFLIGEKNKNHYSKCSQYPYMWNWKSSIQIFLTIWFNFLILKWNKLLHYSFK